MIIESCSAQACLPVTCGELVQGTLDGVPCLVSCPIARYHGAAVSIAPGQGLQPLSPQRAKTQAAVARAMAAWKVAGCVTVEMRGNTPPGRGYGSSTADIGAALYALAGAVGRVPDPLELARLAVQVEPTDSTLFPGLALFGHVDGERFEPLGAAPLLDVIVLDPGGFVDTVIFNRANHRPTWRRLAAQHREAFDLLRQGLRRSDGEAVGRAATLSARAHQLILPNPWLEPSLAWARDIRAVGVCRAHSGTCIGLLVDPTRQDVGEDVRYLARRVPPDVSISHYALVGGGVPPFPQGVTGLQHEASA